MEKTVDTFYLPYSGLSEFSSEESGKKLSRFPEVIVLASLEGMLQRRFRTSEIRITRSAASFISSQHSLPQDSF